MVYHSTRRSQSGAGHPCGAGDGQFNKPDRHARSIGRVGVIKHAFYSSGTVKTAVLDVVMREPGDRRNY